MMLAPDLDGLPPALRGAVEAALPEPADCGEALELLSAYLEAGGERTPAVLLALAWLTFEDARRLVLHRLAEAADEALALLDEADSLGASRPEDFEAELLAARALEHARLAKLRLALEGAPARATELVELAHTMLRNGEDDRTADYLIRRACRTVPPGAGSGVFPIAKRT